MKINNQFKLGQVIGVPIQLNPVKKGSKVPKDWTFLKEYDNIVRAIYVKVVEHTGGKAFYPEELRLDDNFIKSLSVINSAYKDWCKNNQKGNGRYNIYGFNSRWDRVFKRMFKMELIHIDLKRKRNVNDSVPYTADMDSKKIAKAKKAAFMLCL